MLPITNPHGGDVRSSSSPLDQWTKRFQEAERLVDDVVERIAERESVPPSLRRDPPQGRHPRDQARHAAGGLVRSAKEAKHVREVTLLYLLQLMMATRTKKTLQEYI
jgi:hypothetical protein